MTDTTLTTPLDLDADGILAKLERAHQMSTGRPELRRSLYAMAADEVERLRGEVARLEAGLATVLHAGYTHGSAHPGPAALCGSDFCRQVASNIPHYGPGGDLS